ncbi:glycosyltransferase [Butyrivibrio sp. AC2005]|uniref:glycosyltransferase n=1 Tax=Butyrivibrio sp. AC2005 TaxID=1280672 RepID=UPI0004279024|nr:glycosyltransferase [Butyrivibrio sp. AC2005]
MNNYPKVSIVMPVYNAERYIASTIENLLAQSLKEIEIICVNDGSTDSTCDILKKYADLGKIMLMSQLHSNAGEARNLGLAYAKGEYVSFLDADDYFENEMLLLAYNEAIMTDADVVIFRSDQYDEKKGDIRSATWTIDARNIPIRKVFNGSTVKDLFLSFADWPWDKLFKRTTIEKLNLSFQSQPCVNDSYFVKSFLAGAERIICLDDVLVHKRVNNKNSITHRYIDVGGWKYSFNAMYGLRQSLYAWNKFEVFEQDYIRFVMHFIVWNVKRFMESDFYEEMFNAVKGEWLNKLGISQNTIKTCDLNDDVREICEIIRYDSKMYKFMKLIQASGNKDEYVFPFELIEKGANIVLYGAGKVGRSFYRQITYTRYVSMVAWVDENYSKYGGIVESPQSLDKLEFDYIVIALSSRDTAEFVKDKIEKRLGKKNKIVWRQPRVVFTCL